ncbi:conserved hypothetical protein [Chlamydia pneumoniae LPCoLN]|uniref:hypothetical protein n=1 Tax=Chlamydia pneumoniae TaxID=83558 RepID=UPI0001BD9CC0|nr:hypothetical protein [Chlamydia pneumoniae]ACZ33231.1 conserved hypothetical protein [Chlamydia pneumoniae LPCoLN]ETR80136.1 hypothetical protein X556_0540 [Chlamydia pneumoniae B21]
MKKIKQQGNIFGSTTPPINPNENSGVKDQNLFIDQATLSVERNVRIENNLETRDLKVLDTTTSPCEFIVKGNVSAEGSRLHATTLSDGFNIYSKTDVSQTPVCNNISDPQSARDALTFSYYRKTGCQAANLYTYYPGSGYYVAPNTTIETHVAAISSKSVSRNTTPDFSRYADIEPIVKLKQVGIYQVTMQLTRWSGQHDGDNSATLILNLVSGNSKTLLCTSDTRGGYSSDRTSVAVTATFSVTEIVSSSPYDYPWINLESTIWMNLMSLSTCVIWFPFPSNFVEVD